MRNSSAVTRVRFRAHDGEGPRRRRLTALRGPLKGNLESLGYYAVDVCVGTPPTHLLSGSDIPHICCVFSWPPRSLHPPRP